MTLSDLVTYLNIAGFFAIIVYWVIVLNDLSEKWKSTFLLIIVALGIIIIVTHIENGKTEMMASIKATEKRIVTSQDSIKKLLFENLKSD